MKDKITFTSSIKHVKEWGFSARDMMITRGDDPELSIISIPKINKFVNGLHRKEMTIIGARPSNCKSILAIQLALDMANQGKSVLFMSLEMPGERIVERMFCNEHKISNIDLAKGMLGKNASYAHRYDMFMEKLEAMDLVISDMIGRDVTDIGYIETLFKKAPDVIIIDHLNEIRGGDNKVTALEEYLDTLRAYAIRKNIALVVCCQVNRSSRTDGEKRPQLHQLKGAGCIEEKADVVLLLHYPYLYDDNERQDQLEVHVAKNRNGMTGFGVVTIHPEFSRIEE